MKRTLCRVVLSGTVLIGTLLPSTTTAQDQMRFRAMDRNRDGLLTEDELWSRNTPAVLTPAFQAGRDRGLNDGRQAGREDREGPGAWDLEGQRELEQTDAGYRSELGPREQYQAGYLEGFRRGYAEGFGRRR